MIQKPKVTSERTKQLKAEIKPLKAGPAYQPSKERLLRDQMKAFLAKQDYVDQAHDKLFKVLAPEQQGFNKVDLVEFLTYMQEQCGLSKKMATDEANIEKLAKESMIKESKNQKGQMTMFIDKIMKQEMATAEQKLVDNPKL